MVVSQRFEGWMCCGAVLRQRAFVVVECDGEGSGKAGLRWLEVEKWDFHTTFFTSN